MLKILKGDDSNAQTLTVTPPSGSSLAGYRLRFELGDFVREFPAGTAAEMTLPKEWTCRQPLGRQLGTWKLIAPDGRVTTSTNTFAVYVTNAVQDVTAAQTASVGFSANALAGVTFDPNGTSQQMVSFLATLVQRLGGNISE